MFNSIFGKLTAKYPQRIFLENSGIEWDLVVPDSSIESLPNVGESVRVFVWLSHSENAMTLYGFASKEDRALFFDLNKVDGVGPKSAVKIMSSISRSALVRALDGGDLSTLEKIPGLGKKTAQKMLLALKGKLALDDDSKNPQKKCGEFSDVLDALCSMGYDKKQAENALEKVLSTLMEEKSFLESSKKQKEDTLFRRVISELAV